MGINKVTEEDELPEAQEKSALAKDLSKLKDSIQSVVNTRERIPQPLFWSLFNSRINEIKEAKRLKRSMAELLNE